MSFQAYPPHVTLRDKPLSVDAAQELIANHLQASKSSAHLHPDALISTSGVEFAPSGGAQGGIILHHLRRVEASLRGEVLKPEISEVSNDLVLDEMIGETEKQIQTEHEQEGDGTQVGELGQRSNFVADDGEIPEVTAEDSNSTVDKEARKKAKKERARQQKLEKEIKKKRKNEA
ncbi:hypothetical protein SLS56_010305 [Neofusicoccum ribis]|uniref:Uncharacterized protein n=1 Tax=Neofusicoccum ribis TaxID=45134 RepID=A0ABR3SEU4_9PEZI